MSEKLISGVVPPLVTPLLGRDQLDVAGLERLIEHILSAGAHGLFLMGTTGEGPSLSPRLRREVVQVACRANHNRVPVIVGITDTNLETSVELAQFSAEQGAAAAVLAPPPYFPLSQAELLAYIGDVLADLPLPLLLYNMPAMTKIHISLETMRRLTEHSNLIGIKDTSGDMDHFLRVLRVTQSERPDWSVMMGTETLLAEAIAAGGDGGVCGGANLAPALFVALYHAALDNNRERVRRLQAQVLAVGESVYKLDQSPMSAVKGIKSALRVLNICHDAMAAPMCGLGDAEREQLRDVLTTLKLGEAAA